MRSRARWVPADIVQLVTFGGVGLLISWLTNTRARGQDLAYAFIVVVLAHFAWKKRQEDERRMLSWGEPVPASAVPRHGATSWLVFGAALGGGVIVCWLTKSAAYYVGAFMGILFALGAGCEVAGRLRRRGGTTV